MQIEVSLPDATAAERLAQRLTGASDGMSVSLDAGRSNVRVVTDLESNRAVVVVIDAVDAWLTEDGAAAARLSVGERSYTLAGPGWLQGQA